MVIDHIGEMKDMKNDTINRQMAIDAVSDCGICIQRIVDLPPAQPELPDTNVGDMISRQAAIDAVRNINDIAIPSDDVFLINKAEALGELMMLPSAQPQRMRAKWIATTSLQEGQITWRDYKCSNCSHHRRKPMNFCEVCGAKMER